MLFDFNDDGFNMNYISALLFYCYISYTVCCVYIDDIILSLRELLLL